MPPVKHYSSSEVNQYELSSRLLTLTENNNSYTLTQINGQRIYRKAPHAWSGPEPSRNCEVSVDSPGRCRDFYLRLPTKEKRPVLIVLHLLPFSYVVFGPAS